MKEEFKFVEIPEQLKPVIGNLDQGTRIYRTSGDEANSGEWFEAISSVVGNTVSPGGVGMYAPVSRAAVHKRLKEGRLTAFCYHAESTKFGFFGKKKATKSRPFIYIPVSECIAWAEELKERMIRLGHISQEELEGAKPDWSGDFWKWNKRKK